MRFGLVILVAFLSAHALSAPVLVEDTREISVFAQAFDSQGEGPPIGPVIVSRSAPGAFFAEQRAVSSSALGFGANAVAGGIQFTRFHDGPGVHFEGDGAAEVQLDLLDPEGGGVAVSRTIVRLVFELDQDMDYDLSGELTMFAIGNVQAEISVSLAPIGGIEPWFEQSAAGAFNSSGVLEQGTWVLELFAEARTADVLPDTIESSGAVASFRDLEFILIPAPGTFAAVGAIGCLALRRRR